MYDWGLRCLPMNLCERKVGFTIGEVSTIANRWQLIAIADHQNLCAERQQVAAELCADHRDFIDHYEIGIHNSALGIEHKLRRCFPNMGTSVGEGVAAWRCGARGRGDAAMRWGVDQRVDSIGVGTAFGPYDSCGFAGIGAIDDIDIAEQRANVPGDCRLPGACRTFEKEDLLTA